MARGTSVDRSVPQVAMFWRIAVLDLGLATLLVAAPPLFNGPVYTLVRANLAVFIVLLVAAGGAGVAAIAGLLSTRALALVAGLAAMPLSLLAFNFVIAGVLTGAIAYGVETAAMLTTAWCIWHGRDLRARMYVLTVGAIVFTLGASMVIVPEAYANPLTYAALGPSLWLAAPIFIAAGAGLVTAELRTAGRAAPDRVLLSFASLAAVALAVLVNVFAAVGTWTGVVSYGVMAVILMLAAPRRAAFRRSPVLFASLAAVAGAGDLAAALIRNAGGPEIAPSWSLMRPVTAFGLACVAAGFAVALQGTTRMRRLTIVLGLAGVAASVVGVVVALGDGIVDEPQTLLGRAHDVGFDGGTLSGPMVLLVFAVILIGYVRRPLSRLVPHVFVICASAIVGLVALNLLAYMIGSPFLLEIYGSAAMRQHTSIAYGVLALALLVTGAVRLLTASIADRLIGAIAALAVLVILRGYIADAALAHVFVDVADIGEPAYLAAVEEARTLTLILLVTIATATTLMLARTVTMPLREVMDAIARARQGEARARAEVEGEDEIGIVARSFNNLTRELADQSDLAAAVRRAQSDLGEAIVILVGGEPQQWNDALARISGYGVDELSAMRSILDLWPNATRADIAQLLRERSGRTYRLETALIGRDGSSVEIEMAVIPLPERPQEQLAIIRDITERTKAQRSLERLALHDSLTDLPNRALFADRLARTISAAKRASDSFTLLYLDVDRFKEVNDGYGHDVGDALLRALAQRLAAPLSSADTLARFGGDEFAVLLPRTGDVGAASLVADLLRSALRTPFEIDGRTMFVEASFGAVAYPADGDDAETLLRRADIAMYHAKRTGKGIAAYALEVDPQSDKRVALMSDLRHATERGQLELYYQPQIRLVDRRAMSVEALMRWRHPDRGMVPPSDFIPLAEESGFITELSLWVLREAPRQIASLRRRGLEPRVALNLSTRDLHHPRLVETIARELRECGLDARALTVEVTETAAMSDAQRSLETVARLADLGVRVSIDDFGTGYSSLGHLRRLPVRELKIDRTFVNDMLTNPSSDAIVSSTIILGHSLGLTVVAEGVEDEVTLEALTKRGCDVAQGYHIARPMPFAELGDWLGAHDLSREVASAAE